MTFAEDVSLSRRTERGGILISCVMVLLLMLCVTSAHAETSATESIAEVNGEAITVEHLDRALAAKVAFLEEQIYTIKRDELEALIAHRSTR